MGRREGCRRPAAPDSMRAPAQREAGEREGGRGGEGERGGRCHDYSKCQKQCTAPEVERWSKIDPSEIYCVGNTVNVGSDSQKDSWWSDLTRTLDTKCNIYLCSQLKHRGHNNMHVYIFEWCRGVAGRVTKEP